MTICHECGFRFSEAEIDENDGIICWSCQEEQEKMVGHYERKEIAERKVWF